MARFRLYPDDAQTAVMRSHCAHARYVWNLAVEQHSSWRRGGCRGGAPNYLAQAAQLTEARAANPWLAGGSVTVQQQALRDFGQAMANFFGRTHGRPSWRKAGTHEGFRIVGGEVKPVRKINRHWAQVWVPKVGWVRLRLTRPVPDHKSYRITFDRAGRWHIAFAAVPDPISAPGDGSDVGVDRGVAASAALSTGELLNCPSLTPGRAQRLKRLQRRMARAKQGSKRRARLKTQIARLKAREVDARRDWVEKTSTFLARGFDVIAIEDLKIKNMTASARGTMEAPGTNVAAKAALNRGILASGWGALASRLDDKAPGRVVRVEAAYTSARCNACGWVDPKSRESQARFRCTYCCHTAHADVNAGRNISDLAMGRIDRIVPPQGIAVAARGGDRDTGPANREPQHSHTS